MSHDTIALWRRTTTEAANTHRRSEVVVVSRERIAAAVTASSPQVWAPMLSVPAASPRGHARCPRASRGAASMPTSPDLQNSRRRAGVFINSMTSCHKQTARGRRERKYVAPCRLVSPLAARAPAKLPPLDGSNSPSVMVRVRFRSVKNSGLSGRGAGFAVEAGRSTLTSTVESGAATMKTINKTNHYDVDKRRHIDLVGFPQGRPLATRVEWAMDAYSADWRREMTGASPPWREEASWRSRSRDKWRSTSAAASPSCAR